MHSQLELTVQEALAAHGRRAEALLEILHSVQAALGCIPPEAVPSIAAALNRSRAEIQGVIDFYHDYRSEPGGRLVIQVCRAEACQAMGVQALETHIQATLGIGYHETTADGRFSLEPVYCLGNCACAPSLRIEDDVHARVTPEHFDALLEACADDGTDEQQPARHRESDEGGAGGTAPEASP
ncbi:MAG: formate dehydrogenase subunit gamma [Pseudomonadota bacterium]